MTEANAQTKGGDPLSALPLIVLHLLPGVLVAAFDLIAAPIVERNAYVSLAVHTIGNALNALLIVGALLGLAP